MGMLINGEWDSDAKGTTASDGSFVRVESPYRKFVTSPSTGTYPAERNRYNLIVSLACPWAHRTLIYRSLLNLEDCIDVSVVNPISYPNGWTFESFENVVNKTGRDLRYLRDLYLYVDSNFTGKVTVPTLWDKKTHTIVNNESSEIIRMMDGPFCELIGTPSGTMLGGYPLSKIDEMNEFVYKGLNNGVYRVGFATTQTAYDKGVDLLFQTLDHLEQLFSKTDFLLGDKACECDWRLLTTLIRFDTVYYYHFKCNRRKLSSYENLSKYLERLSSIPKIRQTIFQDHIIDHYYLSHLKINPFGIIPIGVRNLM